MKIILCFLRKGRNKMKKALILFIGCLVVLVSCDMTNQKLLFINNSQNRVFYRLLLDTIISNETYVSAINPHDSVRPLFANMGQGTWEFKINNKSIDSTLYIYVFSPDIKNKELPNPKSIKIKDLNGDIIGERQYIRKGFKIKDLNNLNWILNYPEDFK
jgi:hypothetical protein